MTKQQANEIYTKLVTQANHAYDQHAKAGGKVYDRNVFIIGFLAHRLPLLLINDFSITSPSGTALTKEQAYKACERFMNPSTPRQWKRK